MLDLMTLAASMGLQEDLNKMREETGATICEEDVSETAPATTFDNAVDIVADALSVAESAVVSAAANMVPSADMMSTVMEGVSMEAPTVDLTLPTHVSAKK